MKKQSPEPRIKKTSARRASRRTSRPLRPASRTAEVKLAPTAGRVLLAGRSRTERRQLAARIAGELGRDLYRVELSRVVSKYIGETEKNLREVLAAAEQAGAVLFFDEADALFGKRTEVKDSHDRYANIEVSHLLARIEDYAGTVIVATHRKENLDPAFLRRLRLTSIRPLPATVERRRTRKKPTR